MRNIYRSIKKQVPTLTFVSIALLLFFKSLGAPTAVITDSNATRSLPAVSSHYIDVNGIETPDRLPLQDFRITKSETLNFNPSVESVWLKFEVVNRSSSNTIFLNVAYSNIGKVILYKKSVGGYTQIGHAGNSFNSKATPLGTADIVLDLVLPANARGEYLVHIKSTHPIILPAYISTFTALAEFTIFQNSVICIYLGVLIIMFLYNLFLYFSTLDKNYLYYVIYIFFLAFAQLTSAGYAFKYFWPETPEINQYAVIITSTLASLTGVVFSMIFLNTSQHTRTGHLLMKGSIIVYLIGIIVSFTGIKDLSYYILNYNGIISVIIVLATSIHLIKKGFRPAIFYLIAWLALLLTFLVLVFVNLNLLPYNTFTAYAFYIGSVIEVALLSLALADRINALKKEKERSQAEALKISVENEQLVKQQNLLLEQKVAERTEELQHANTQVTQAYKNLKETQTQLVEAEKMASLGQLTAGIAHEINNPINFVKNNIKPLKLDFKDLVEVIDEYGKLHEAEPAEISSRLEEIAELKESMDVEFIKNEVVSLMTGIENGAERTAEIVRGLRTFSRLDESVIKTVNIHEGIDSTLILLRSNIGSNIKIVKDYDPDGTIECYPGKLNQVFMNILSNAVHAINAGPLKNQNASITITTKRLPGDLFEIRIKDTGTGMPADVKQKIFDPFFTTKDVGEGTGLGMAIVFKIIKEHSGKIEVESQVGEGSEFIITLNNSIPGKPTI